MKVKLISLLLVAAFLTGIMLVPSAAQKNYDDVPSNAWYYNAVSFCCDAGYMDGTGDMHFSPEAAVTREMFTLILAKVDGADLSGYTGNSPFTDVPAGQWYTAAVNWACDIGITSGMGDGSFGRGRPLTRAQLVTFLFAYSEQRGYDTQRRADLSFYKDINSGAWYKTGFSWAVDEVLISGTSSDTASPDSGATRAQMATIVYKYIQYKEDVTNSPAYDTAYDSFVPTARFVFASDTHVSLDDTSGLENMRAMFGYMEDYAESDEYNKIDGYFFAGDLTNDGTPEQAAAYKSVVDEMTAAGSTIYSVYGNHEYYGTLGDAEAKCQATGASEFLDLKINGIHIIGVSPDDNAEDSYIDRTQELTDALSRAANDTPEMPVLVFQHHGALAGEYRSVLSQYPQVINLSGHSHNPVHVDNSVIQRDYTEVELSTLGMYLSVNTGYGSGTENKCQRDGASCTVIEINVQGEVLIKPFDVTTGDFWHTPTSYDHPDQKMVFSVPTAWEKDSFNYTGELTNDIPMFGRRARACAYRITNNSISIDYTPGDDADGIMYYLFTVTNLDTGRVQGTPTATGFYYLDSESLPDMLSKSFYSLESGTNYKIEISAFDICGNRSGNSITMTAKTK